MLNLGLFLDNFGTISCVLPFFQKTKHYGHFNMCHHVRYDPELAAYCAKIYVASGFELYFIPEPEIMLLFELGAFWRVSEKRNFPSIDYHFALDKFQ